jgi:type I restriction enzyme R subunit
VQIELKRRGLELKEAFNQINRYHKHSFGANTALFQYVQIFVISNGVNTKYYANNKNQSFKQTFYWTDVENKRLTNILNGFTSEFLEPCHFQK